jgi:hypothetical protein
MTQPTIDPLNPWAGDVPPTPVEPPPAPPGPPISSPRSRHRPRRDLRSAPRAAATGPAGTSGQLPRSPAGSAASSWPQGDVGEGRTRVDPATGGAGDRCRRPVRGPPAPDLVQT